MVQNKKIVLLSGPTASGKSKFAIQLSRKLNGEIINADSMQVYKQLNILSARPSKNDCKKITKSGNKIFFSKALATVS